MNFLEMRTEVNQLIGDEVGVQFKSTQVNRYLNQGQRYVAGELEIYQKAITATNVASDPAYHVGGYLLPADIIRPLRLTWLKNGIYEEVPFLQNFPHGEEFVAPTLATYGNVPDGYYLQSYPSSSGRRIEFYPPLPSGFVIPGIHLIYIAYPADLVDDLDVSPLPASTHELIVMYALARCKLQENDYEGYRFIMQHEIRERTPQLQYEAGSHAATFGTLMPNEA